MDVAEKETLFQRMYGKKSFTTGAISGKTATVVEDPDWIQQQTVTTTVDVDDFVGTGATLASSASGSRASSRTSQVVVKGSFFIGFVTIFNVF